MAIFRLIFCQLFSVVSRHTCLALHPASLTRKRRRENNACYAGQDNLAISFDFNPISYYFVKEPPSLNFQETASSPELFCGMILREKTPRSLLSEIVAIYSGEVKWCSNRPFYRYGGHIEFIRFKEYYGIPRGHWLSIYARFSDKKRISMYISREKGDRHYIQTRLNDLFFPLQSFSRKT